ncbi:MAG: glycosyl transferase [Planctomycetia bacterium]|nr:glycosyl transferase [Planctomycetia bacterium]
MVNIITLKWGTRYGPEFVNRLRGAVARHLRLEHRFVCFTDDPTGLDSGIVTHPIPPLDLPDDKARTPWRKIGLFSDELPIRGPSLFLDLDLLVVGSIDCFFTHAPDRIPIIHNWVEAYKVFKRRPEIGNSSVFRWEAGACGGIVRQYYSEKEWALKTFWPPQTYLTHCIRDRMVYWPEEWVCSFKRHCIPAFPLNHFLAPKMPEGVRIVVFHGRPDPDEAIMGYRGTKPHHRCLPTPWVAEHWR